MDERQKQRAEKGEQKKRDYVNIYIYIWDGMCVCVCVYPLLNGMESYSSVNNNNIIFYNPKAYA